ncbi:MAG: GNAT family protein [Ferruginibacter sp.]
MTLFVTDTISLELISEIHAIPVFDLVAENRQHLRQWLPWVDNMRTIHNFHHYIQNTKKEIAAGRQLSYIIIVEGNVAGRSGVYNINKQLGTASLGYWLSEAYEGKGIITKVCKKLIDFSFSELQLDEVEIRCATDNLKSEAIAKRLNFNWQFVIKNGEFINKRFIDLNVYKLTKTEWKPTIQENFTGTK